MYGKPHFCLRLVSIAVSVTELVDETLSGPTLEAVGEGLTEEELELAKQILEVYSFILSFVYIQSSFVCLFVHTCLTNFLFHSFI